MTEEFPLKYKIFSWGKEYTINSSETYNKIKHLDSYRYLIWSKRPHIIWIIILPAFITIVFSSFIFPENFEKIKIITINLVWIVYGLISLIYYIKFRKILKEKS